MDVRGLLLLSLLIPWAGVRVGATSTAGFPDLATMRRDAYQLYPIRSPTTPRQRLFPRLKFTCTANITKWVFLAMWEEVASGSGDGFPEFQVWRRAGEGDEEFVKVAASTTEGAVCNGFLCEHVLSEPLVVTSGDVFGLHQPHKDANTMEVMYQMGGGGAVHYRRLADRPLSSFNVIGSDRSPDHTLVSVVTDPPDCSTGFLSEEAVNLYSSLVQMRTHEGEQHIFPGVSFSCSGTVTKWIVGGHTRTSATEIVLEHPEFQLWRGNGSEYEKGDITDNTITDLLPTAHPNVYEYVPSPPLEFSPGDVLGVYQPMAQDSQLVLHYQWKAGQRSYTLETQSSMKAFSVAGNVASNYDLPFVGLEITGGEVGSCTSGFLNTEDLRAKASEIVTFKTHAGQQRLFPNMRFSSEGQLVTWIFAAEYRRNGLRLPEFQIWREVADNAYTLVDSSARDGELLQTGYLNVYEYHLDQSMSFQDGDFLGIFQPQEDSQFLLVSAEGAGHPAHYTFTSEALETVSNISAISSDNDYPLVAVKISPVVQDQPDVDSTSPTITSPTPPPTTPPSSPPTTQRTTTDTSTTSEVPSTDPSKSSRNQLILATLGTAAGLVLGILGTTLIVIGVVCACIGRRRKRRHLQANGHRQRMENGEGDLELEGNKSRYSALPPPDSAVSTTSSFSHGRPVSTTEGEEEEEEHIYDRPASVIRTKMSQEPFSPPPSQVMYDQPRVPSQMSNGVSLTPLSSPPSVNRAESLRTTENVAYSHTSNLDLSHAPQCTDGSTEEDGTSDYTSDSMEYVAAYGRPLPINLLYDLPYGFDGMQIQYARPQT